MDERRRVAAVIVRQGHVLMVRERGRGPTGRHDGQEYWTLPGGGISPGETPEEALVREVREEVGLSCRAIRFLYDFPYPSGRTACYAVEVPEAEEPQLGVENDVACACPRMVGVDWVALPQLSSDTQGLPIPMILLATPL